jgi:hypothetical protein
MHNETLIRPTVYTDPTGHVATFVSETSADHRGMLHLRIEGPDMEPKDFDPADQLPSGCTAARRVVQCAQIMDKETRALAVSFLQQWPKGPQL